MLLIDLKHIRKLVSSCINLKRVLTYMKYSRKLFKAYMHGKILSEWGFSSHKLFRVFLIENILMKIPTLDFLVFNISKYVFKWHFKGDKNRLHKHLYIHVEERVCGPKGLRFKDPAQH